jgi:hypothetical protein
MAGIRERLANLTEAAIPAFEADLAAVDAPWTPGTPMPPW